jgi:hypothetical protein
MGILRRSAAREKAENIAKARNTTLPEIAPMALSEGDSKFFLEALERGFVPSKALIGLKKKHDSLNVTDETQTCLCMSTPSTAHTTEQALIQACPRLTATLKRRPGRT